MRYVVICAMAAAMAGQVGAETLVAPFAGLYTITDLGAAPGVSANYGGLVISAGNNNVLLLGGAANTGGGVIDALGLIRGAGGHITGFSGSTSLFSTAPNIDGGLAYAPNGDLLYTGYPNNVIGQIKPGSTAPDKIVSAPGSLSSLGTLQFIPAGYPGAGNFVLGSYNNGLFCTAPLTADLTGTYDIGDCANTTAPAIGGGPEGIIYVPLGSPQFTNPSVLIALYGEGVVASFDIDAKGLPIAATRRNFITGLSGAEGAAVDPLTGDFLFSTFGGGNHVFAVSGFSAPVTTPEPGGMLLLGTGLISLLAWHRRKA